MFEDDESSIFATELRLSDAFLSPAPPAPPDALIAASKSDLPPSVEGTVGLFPPISITSSPVLVVWSITISGGGGGGGGKSVV